jgi:hypothetical protein
MVAVCVVFGAHRERERELLHAGGEDAALALLVGYLKLWRGVDDGMGVGGGELVILTRGRNALLNMSTQDKDELASEGSIGRGS